MITGVSKWIDLLNDEVKNNLKDWFANIAKLKNCLFIFIDKQQDLKTLYYENWYKSYVPNDRGVYLGKGIANYTYISVSNSYKELNEILPDNFGFNIVDGRGIKIKVVEEDING